MEQIPTLTFHDGGKIPQIGLGCLGINKQGLVNGIKLGYRHIDGAYFYKNQNLVGEAVKESGIPRQEFFLTSKVWRSHMTRQLAEESLRITLEDLQTDYVDLLLIHWPLVDNVDRQDGQKLKEHRIQVWEALIEFKKQGKVRHIGVSNFLPKHLDQIIEATGEVPVVNQIINNPYIVLDDVLKYCHERNILVEAWAPLGGGKHNLLEDKILNEIGKKHGKTAAEIALRWAIEKQYVIFPKSNNEERLKDNLKVFEFRLSEDEVKIIDEIHHNVEVNRDGIRSMFVA